MNMKTRQRLESEPTAPAPTQPVDKLRISEAHATPPPDTFAGPVKSSTLNPGVGCHCKDGSYLYCSCFTDDE